MLPACAEQKSPESLSRERYTLVRRGNRREQTIRENCTNTPSLYGINWMHYMGSTYLRPTH